jgi:hypothetical protein
MTASPDDPEARTRATCVHLLERMEPLRRVERPSAYAPPTDVHEALIDVRGRLDLAEQVLIDVGTFRAEVRSRAALLEGEADEAYFTAMTELAKSSRRLEFEGVQDRICAAKLAALPKTHRARTARRVADIADSCYERVRTMYFSLRDLRGELLSSLRYLEWESNMERG